MDHCTLPAFLPEDELQRLQTQTSTQSAEQIPTKLTHLKMPRILFIIYRCIKGDFKPKS